MKWTADSLIVAIDERQERASRVDHEFFDEMREVADQAHVHRGQVYIHCAPWQYQKYWEQLNLSRAYPSSAEIAPLHLEFEGIPVVPIEDALGWEVIRL